MKKYIPYLLSIWLITAFTFLATEKGFAQTSQNEPGVADSIQATNNEKPAYVKGITAGRAQSLVGGVIGLISLIVGWVAKARSSQKGAKIAVALGLLSIFLAVVHLITVGGAVFGSGSGKAGSLIALPLAITGTILGWLALRSRKANSV